jgi:hypothetical protein
MTTLPKIRLALALALLVTPFLSCQTRLVDGDPLESQHICSIVNAARVYDEQGNPVRMVVGPRGGNSRVCLCLTPDEFWTGAYDDYYNDQAYATCLENATRMGYPEANDCAYWYEQRHWVDMVQIPPEYEGLYCDPDGASEPLGCSVR